MWNKCEHISERSKYLIARYDIPKEFNTIINTLSRLSFMIRMKIFTGKEKKREHRYTNNLVTLKLTEYKVG